MQSIFVKFGGRGAHAAPFSSLSIITYEDGIIDVCVTHIDAPSYRDHKPDKVLQLQEREKKKKYLNNCLQQRRTFTPFVVSSDGLLGREAKSLIKQLSVLLTEKWNKPYSVVCGIIR